VARARKHAAKDELHGRRARPDRVYRGEGLEPQQEDSRNAAIKCAKVQTLAVSEKDSVWAEWVMILTVGGERGRG
jgi:hypothetical protein